MVREVGKGRGRRDHAAAAFLIFKWDLIKLSSMSSRTFASLPYASIGYLPTIYSISPGKTQRGGLSPTLEYCPSRLSLSIFGW